MILIVDGNNLAFISACTERLTTSSGQPSQVVYRFLRSLHFVTEKFNPRKVFVTWDGGRSSKRKELYPEYKENRKKTEKSPQQKQQYLDFKVQLPVVKEAVLNLGLFSVEGPGVEADDLIALLVKQCRAKDDCIIVSSDKDFCQLISPGVSLYSIIRKEQPLITADNIADLFGVPAESWLDFRCVVGDSSDGISGVPGAGEKTAKGVLSRFGSLDAFLGSSHEKLGRREEAIYKSLDVIKRNRLLMDLNNPIGPFDGVKISRTDPNHKSLKETIRAYELNSIYLEFPKWVSVFAL